MMNRIKAFVLAGCVLLCGCATLTPPASQPLPQSWKERQQALLQMKHWQLEGALAVHTASDGGSANLNWQQNGQNYNISLFGPLGAHAVHISGSPGLATLQTAEGRQFQAADAEQLLYQQLGWKLPVSNLYYWARGLPLPAQAAQTEFDQYHRLIRLRQQGWRLWFKQYAVFNHRELPTKIVLEHPQLNVKLVIYQWGN